ncbi:VOC family protein [Dactylosporangium darangshiense]|uniref:VOC family protein n=1 Tax=Dactylosporangium darangshiense TaxID=579108 RepID=A0ABP8CUI5_9ACTN
MRVRGYAPATPCWSVLSSGDAAAATRFYCELFGWTAEPAEDGTTTFLLHGLAVAGLAPAPGGRAAWLTYVSTEDVEATAALVTAAGGTVLQPPADLAGRGRAALFVDPASAVFGAWQRGRFAGAQVANESFAICWSETVTRDIAGAAEFYGKVFGWTEQQGTAVEEHEYHEWISTNRVVGGMSPMGEQYPPETPQHWRTIFAIDDCAGFVARAQELGGRVLAGPIDAGIGFAAQVMDPTGGMFLAIDMLPELRDLLG